MKNNNISILFDVQELYYLPQYLPVYHEFLKRNKGNATFVFHHGKFDKIIESIIKSENLNHTWVQSNVQANEFYQNKKLIGYFLEIHFHFLIKFMK